MQWLVRTAIADMFPGGYGFPSVDECGLREFVAQTRHEAPRRLWIGVVLGAWVYAWTPALTIAVPLPAFCLPRHMRLRHAAMVTSHWSYLVRQAVLLPKLLGALCWAREPRVRRALGLEAYRADPRTWRQA